MAVRAQTGKDVQISIGSDVVGCAQKISFTVQAGTVDVTCAASGEWKQVKAGQKSWTGNLSGIVRVTTSTDIASNVTSQELFGMLRDGTEVTVVFETVDGTAGDFIYTGTALVTNLNADFTLTADGEAVFSADLTGTGELVLTVAS